MLSHVGRWVARLPAPVRRVGRRLPGASRLRDRTVGTPQLPPAPPGGLRPVVYLPTWAEWDVMRQRPQYLMAAFAAAGHDAYFVDQRVVRPREADGVRIVPSLDHVPREGVILYVHFAPLRTLFDKFAAPVVVYDILDDLTIYEIDEVDTPPGRRVAAHHPELMVSAAQVTASSPVLVDRHRHERPDVLLVPNGVDFDRFSAPTARPPDLPPADPERPVVGYHGAVGEWFAFDVFHETATRLPGCRFVVVGPVYPRVADEAARLRALPNVTMIPERPSDTMPAYVQAFDAGAIWFAVDRMTEGVVPLKLFEYMAAGIPTVSTPLPSCVDEPLVRTAGDGESFAAAVTAALAERSDAGSVARLKKAGAAAGWDARLAPLLELLDRAGQRRMPR